VWRPYKQKYIDAIEGVQRRATKQVTGLKEMNYIDRLKYLDLPTLTYRRDRGDMIEVYKLLHSKYDEDLPVLLKKRDIHMARTGQRGHNLMLLKQRANKKLRQHSFSLRVTDLWNSLPDKVVNAPSVNSFKNRLDKCWKNQEARFNYKVAIDRKSTLFITDDENIEQSIEEEHLLRTDIS
jgi:hypothetical protein